MPDALPFNQDLFEEPSKEFKQHLLKEGNVHIVFSGKFGIGKTFFLNHFFKEDTQKMVLTDKPKFEVFTLWPVNYSIATNEDIYRYIKYDVIYQLLAKEIPLLENDFAFIDTLPDFGKKNMEQIFKMIVTMVPKVGKSLVQLHDELKVLITAMREHHEKQTSPEGEAFVNFLESVQNEENSLYENDVVVNLIRNVLVRQRNETHKQNVLIIDDLDRIDPEHIFRVLNVFAARLDIGARTSLGLGFDKIILVCDIRNIKNIFHARYGVATDFNGYVDKFYSDEVFAFDNRKILERIAEKAFAQVGYNNAPTAEHEQEYQRRLVSPSSLAILLLRLFVQTGHVTLRKLYSKMTFSATLNFNRRVRLGEKVRVEQIEHPTLGQFAVLKKLVGGYTVMIEYLQRMTDHELDISVLEMTEHGRTMMYNLTAPVHRFNEMPAPQPYRVDDLLFQYVHAKDDKGLSYNFGTRDGNLSRSSCYPFTKKEFKQLLIHFVEWLDNIGN